MTPPHRNSIEDKGVALLIRSLRANPSLEHLSLGGNRLTDEAAKTIASLLRSGCSSLRQLNLSGVPPKPVRYGASQLERVRGSVAY